MKPEISSTAKNLGIWMDHGNSHLMEFTTDPNNTKKIDSEFTHTEKDHSLERVST